MPVVSNCIVLIICAVYVQTDDENTTYERSGFDFWRVVCRRFLVLYVSVTEGNITKTFCEA